MIQDHISANAVSGTEAIDRLRDKLAESSGLTVPEGTIEVMAVDGSTVTIPAGVK